MKKNKEYYKITKCEFSKKNDLMNIISLGKMPAVNNYINIEVRVDDVQVIKGYKAAYTGVFWTLSDGFVTQITM